ncbi:MAG: leucyl/phenylalanyl-tRNA--protein transferase [Bacteroidia bacterium]
MPVYSLPNQPLFPPVSHAEEDGLLAVGGDLSPERLLAAYARGIFPWYTEGKSPILWWSPDPRMVLFPNELNVSKSMKQLLRREAFQVTYDREFAAVISACGHVPRPGQDGTWLGNAMMEAYQVLHQLGHAHSVEVWQEGRLVGGLYGVAMGKTFCGESMFAHASNASKYGFITLVRDLIDAGFQLIDCQVYTEHLESLGAREISRNEFVDLLGNGLNGDFPKFPVR